MTEQAAGQTATEQPVAVVDLAGELHDLLVGGELTIGRGGDVVVDEDNPYLHRRFLVLRSTDGLVWLHNIGSRISATVADERGLAQTWLSPGARVPVVFPETVVWFTAGPTTYELVVTVTSPPFVPTVSEARVSDTTTIGRVSLTPDQKLMCVALAESLLRRGVRGRGEITPSQQAAARLGWTITRFNRKLDNVCEKFARLGVRGVVAEHGHPASARRQRLVEHLLASRLLVEDDLVLLDQV